MRAVYKILYEVMDLKESVYLCYAIHVMFVYFILIIEFKVY